MFNKVTILHHLQYPFECLKENKINKKYIKFKFLLSLKFLQIQSLKITNNRDLNFFKDQ